MRLKRTLKWTSIIILFALMLWGFIAYWTSTNNCDRDAGVPSNSIGADHVVDYAKEDFTKSDERYDVIFDNVCNHSFFERRRVLTPKGICVLAGMGGAGVKGGQAIGRIAGNLFTARGLSAFTDQKFAQYITKLSKGDLVMLADLIQAGKLKPVIERIYKLSEAPEALRYLNEGHARGKIIISAN